MLKITIDFFMFGFSKRSHCYKERLSLKKKEEEQQKKDNDVSKVIIK
jgi:hypothetical protein